MDPRRIKIADFDYDLPEERIAFHPLAQRDSSKLLLWDNNRFFGHRFSDIDKLLPANSLLVENDTRVINARLVFHKESGARIEIFCLEPADAASGFAAVMAERGKSRWRCLVGGIARWKNEDLLMPLVVNGEAVTLKALLIKKLDEGAMVEFQWAPTHLTFRELIAHAGKVPLPPYIKRAADENDAFVYQTIFAAKEGSVAAPTAGLHFTPAVLGSLEAKGIETAAVTLHVSAGTFKPVKAAEMDEHTMHAEYIDVSLETIEKLIAATFITATGTTSLRTIESLYWLGAKLLRGRELSAVTQWEPYERGEIQPSKNESLGALAHHLRGQSLTNIFTSTSLIIAPGYKFRVADALITNFHQPRSTLLLLVAAAGGDWKGAYNYAMENDFRFLSYGDSNLILIAPEAKAG